MILNKNSTGSAELKALLGFIFKSTNFTNLITYIAFAESDIKLIIGKEVFNIALAHYQSDHFCIDTDEDHPEYEILDKLVKLIQFPVAMSAYFMYVPSLDVSHSDKGRQIFVNDTDKPAFEWQIKNDNVNLIALLNRGIDLLLEFLDESIDVTYLPDGKAPAGDSTEPKDPLPGPDEVGPQGPTSPEAPAVPVILIPWRDTAEYAVSKELFVNTAIEFSKVFSIENSRVTFLRLVPFIRFVQSNTIRACFRKEMYEEICTQIKDGSLSEENKTILPLAAQPLVLLSMGMAIKRLSVQLLPDGLFSSLITGTINSKQTTLKVDRNEVSANLERDGLVLLRKLQDHLKMLELLTTGAPEDAGILENRMNPHKPFIRL